MTYVEFLIDKKAEAKNIPSLVNLDGMDIFTRENIKNLSWKTKKQIYPVISKGYDKQKKELLLTRDFCIRYWGKIEKDFVNTMEILMGIKIKKAKICYITPSLVCSIADVLGRKNAYIRTGYTENQLSYIILHELIHLHYADALVELKLPKALNSPLVEGVDHILLFKSKLRRLLPKTVKYSGQKFNQINKRFMGELNKAWKNRKNFKSFMLEAIEINSKFDNVIIC